MAEDGESTLLQNVEYLPTVPYGVTTQKTNSGIDTVSPKSVLTE
jgi:hypothetical protein